jgi:xenotropic and polytropic retrovirus receptor 1
VSRELDDDLVPEWRYKYLSYKEGKKKIKAVTRALKEASRSPQPNQFQSARPSAQSEDFPETPLFTHYDFNQRNKPTPADRGLQPDGAQKSRDTMRGRRRESLTKFAKSPPVLIPHNQMDGSDDSSPGSSPPPETTPLQSTSRRAPGGHYGSFHGSSEGRPTQLPNLELPDPAMKPSTSQTSQPPPTDDVSSPTSQIPHATPSPGTRPESQRKGSLARLFQRNQNPSGSSQVFSKSNLRKVFHARQLDTPYTDNVQLEVYEKLDARQKEFYNFLDKELNKVEDFYKMKEDEASHRLEVLRQQLHELRDRRMEELQRGQHGEQIEGEDGELRGDIMNFEAIKSAVNNGTQANGHGMNPFRPIGDMLAGNHKIGRTTKSLANNTSPPGPMGRRSEDKQDYVRRDPEAPSFRVAKRRLKLALQEFYRGLELLKSYALLNRTAFRKINKKYDKAVKARPTMRYYSEKVAGAQFVKSENIGEYLVAVEDLYARYFEKGNHKIAVTKLRSKLKGGDHTSVAFRNGLYVAAGVCFAVSGLVTALDRILHPATRDQFLETSYLLQLYGGYFLGVLLFLIFCLDCRVWTVNRINYQFIFEYDTRHTLDWRQLAELPCFFLFLNGLVLWLNFRQNHGDRFYLYWPVVLVAITLVIMALPFKIFYYQARRWWGYSNWRLLFAGLYPVEFRDFYLGDMYCSVTYSMSQIELFFCLYVNEWINPNQCNSNHSRLMGFFATLPAIWRAFQCLRRYRDSGTWFPHLANFAKYCGNILYYMTLSMYRINMNGQTKAAFLVFATVNGCYCSFWDIYFDWSLGSPFSKNWLLRDRLGYKRKRLYYAAIPIDVILRQQWIFFAVFAEDLQHSSAVSFFVSLIEVLRRGMWSLFRVENEHCNNVDNFRASRDVPLPYKIPDEEGRTSEDRHRTPAAQALSATGADLDRTATQDTTSTMRQRRGAIQTPTLRALQRVGTRIASAHAADFEKRRKPADKPDEDAGDGQESSDEDDDDRDATGDRQDSEAIQEASKMVRRASRGG